MVILVGAGPGDPGLITVKGLEALREAEVLIYDHLIPEELLAACPPQCKKIYVGKKSGEHTLPQGSINRLLVEEAQKGKKVVRLKGGDPFLFGRGGEEAEALAQAGVPFWIVPGVTSAIAAPAYAGIPVTHRGYASSVAFVTGHEDQNKSGSSICWEHLGRGSDTLVFLMGMRNLPVILGKLQENGLEPQTPAALIRWGTTSDQVVLQGTVADLAQRAKQEGLGPPAVLVVGKVVALRERLDWLKSLPLWGKRILVTRAREQASSLAQSLRTLGAQAVEFPTISVEPPTDWSELDEAISSLGEYDWLILTSPNGARFFLDRLLQSGRDCRALGRLLVAAMGTGTARALEQRGVRADLIPDEFRAEALAQALSQEAAAGKRFLLARAEQARDVLPETLRQLGGRVNVVTTYRTVVCREMNPRAQELLRERKLDAVTFTSSSTVTNLARLVGEELKELLAGVTVACIGPITANTALELGLKPHVVASRYTIEGLVEALVAHFRAGKEVS